MLIDLKDTVSLSDLDLFKIIISSADHFKGLYQITNVDKDLLKHTDHLNLRSFLEVVHLSAKETTWSKSAWINDDFNFHELMADKDELLRNCTDPELDFFLRTTAPQQITDIKSYSLAVIDTENLVDFIIVDRTYYMMGSLIHFGPNTICISFDDFRNTQSLKLNVDFKTASSYIDSILGASSLNKLFFFAEIIAELTFDTPRAGKLFFDPIKLESLLNSYSLLSPIVAAPTASHYLPIRFGKFTSLKNVLK